MTVQAESHYLTSSQAAAELGVSSHQIAMLVKNGEVNALRPGRSLLIDPYSLRQYKLMRRGKGRPLSPDVAWGALWVLSGLEASWLSYHQQRRLYLKLDGISARDLIWQMRKRCTLRVFRAGADQLDDLRKALLLSGKSTDRPDIFGMPGNTHEIEGYADETQAQKMKEGFGLVEDIAGNVLVHIPASEPWDMADIEGHALNGQMPVAAVAADLAVSLDPRESHAGTAALQILLRALRTT